MRLPPDLVRRIDAIADSQLRTRSDTIRLLLYQIVAAVEQDLAPLEARLRSDALESARLALGKLFEGAYRDLVEGHYLDEAKFAIHEAVQRWITERVVNQNLAHASLGEPTLNLLVEAYDEVTQRSHRLRERRFEESLRARRSLGQPDPGPEGGHE